MNRRKFITVGLILCSPPFASRLLATTTWTTYHETVSSILISKDETKIVVLTPHYHYVFDAPSQLAQALKEPLHQYVKGVLGGFQVRENGDVSGTVTLLLFDAPNEVIDAAVSIGFERTERGADAEVTVHGTRYKASYVKPSDQYKLNKTYDIEVTSEQQQREALPSPVKKLIGGPLVLGVLVLFPLMVFTGCALSGDLARGSCHE